MLEAVCVVVTQANRTIQTKPKMVPVLVFILLIIWNLSADLRIGKNHYLVLSFLLCIFCSVNIFFILNWTHEKYVCI